ncbi:hypothetical protein P2R15_22220, partial [Escherichia coli]
MNSNVLTQTIVTGSDPRGLPEFSAIREEINKASPPSQPELNWKLVESLALAIFKANGVNRPGFPGECFICELRLPDHRFRWK